MALHFANCRAKEDFPGQTSLTDHCAYICSLLTAEHSLEIPISTFLGPDTWYQTSGPTPNDFPALQPALSYFYENNAFVADTVSQLVLFSQKVEPGMRDIIRHLVLREGVLVQRADNKGDRLRRQDQSLGPIIAFDGDDCILLKTLVDWYPGLETITFSFPYGQVDVRVMEMVMMAIVTRCERLRRVAIVRRLERMGGVDFEAVKGMDNVFLEWCKRVVQSRPIRCGDFYHPALRMPCMELGELDDAPVDVDIEIEDTMDFIWRADEIRLGLG
ncbi:hypothetical protein MMC19_004284 [Ptychographa xylographoides]|nr:hypothetical protein [Ptychographa xylographoides]